MTDKPRSDLVYALGDYKQLVIAYKTKYASMVRQVTFWKTTVIWFAAAVFMIAMAAAFVFADYRRNASGHDSDIAMLEERINILSGQLERSRDQLAQVRSELARKNEAIKQLEKNASTASKKLLEKVLSQPQERQPQ